MGWLDTIDLIAREALLFAGIGLLVGGLDDLAVDILWWAHRLRHYGRRPPRVADLPDPPPRRLVVFVPAWDEAAVIGAMLRTARARWAAADYRILVGAYPNDPATQAEVARIAAVEPRIRMVIGPRPGPTTKADCLNTLWRAMVADPETAGAAAVVLHDAEDVVHADEPALFAALIGAAAVVQIPVLPLIRAGSWISGVAADDFAQAHAGPLVVRTALGAGMPLAGTGCAIAVPMLARLAAERRDGPFDPASLVEDYELGLRIAALGGRGRFARVIGRDGNLVAVRAYFPDTLGAAVRQKARWITGIALAGWDRTGWGRPRALVSNWFLARDRRTPLAMLVLACAWTAAPLWLGSVVAHRWAGQPAAPLPGLIVTLLGCNAALLGWRSMMRAQFTAQAYGWRQGLMSVPRMLLGNVVALLAAMRAVARYARMLLGAPLVWDKTAHAYPVTAP